MMATDARTGVEVAGIAVDLELHVTRQVAEFGIWMGSGII
jgi:hypothetical protein